MTAGGGRGGARGEGGGSVYTRRCAIGVALASTRGGAGGRKRTGTKQRVVRKTLISAVRSVPEFWPGGEGGVLRVQSVVASYV